MKLVFCIMMLTVTAFSHAGEIIRYPLPNNSTFPIASGVEVPEGRSIVFASGMVPAAANQKAEKYSSAYWGDTKVQTISVFQRIEASLKEKGLGLSDVIKLTVFLVGDPAKDNKMDFGGFMEGYTQFFGTKTQPNLPARAVVQVAGLVRENMMVEIEVIAVRPKN